MTVETFCFDFRFYGCCKCSVNAGLIDTKRLLKLLLLALVVQTLNSTIHWINHYPADSVIYFRNTYWLDSDLSGGQRYPTFEQPGPEGIFRQNFQELIGQKYQTFMAQQGANRVPGYCFFFFSICRTSQLFMNHSGVYNFYLECLGVTHG